MGRKRKYEGDARERHRERQRAYRERKKALELEEKAEREAYLAAYPPKIFINEKEKTKTAKSEEMPSADMDIHKWDTHKCNDCVYYMKCDTTPLAMRYCYNFKPRDSLELKRREGTLKGFKQRKSP